jgi:CDP-glucose 4,6-dehydratase
MVIENSDFWRGKRVLLTGHTGFKGSWLLLWLLELGAEVWGYSLASDPAPNLFCLLEPDMKQKYRSSNCFHDYRGDITDLKALSVLVDKAQPDVVFHLAAQALVLVGYSDPLTTWSTNVQGSLNLLEALKPLTKRCAVVMITTDKVYKNKEWFYGYRENDPLGGCDPYSGSKAAAEIAISSWRSSFCGEAAHQSPQLFIATARAGNVIGGGDWAPYRIVPDAIRALVSFEPISVRNPLATRPWQHVLEPLGGYLRLAEALINQFHPPCEAFNFGPLLLSNRSVKELIETILEYWPGQWIDTSDSSAPHEANMLHLQIDKAYHQLGWHPRWDYTTTIERTVDWYRSHHDGASALACCLADLNAYTSHLSRTS